MQHINSATSTNGAQRAIFDCSTLTIIDNTVGTASWRALGGGWIEFTTTSAVVSAASAGASYQVRPTQTAVFPYAANGTDGKHIASIKLLANGAGANLFPSSDPNDASFTKTQLALSQTATTEEPIGPLYAITKTKAEDADAFLNGAATGTRLVEASGTTNSRIYIGRGAFAVSDPHKIRLKAKALTRKWIRLISNAGVLFDCYINLASGTVINNVTAATISLSYLGASWWQIEINAVATATTTTNFQIIVLDDTLTWPNRTGDGTSKITVREFEHYTNGALTTSTSSFSGWTVDGLTITENAETFLGYKSDLAPPSETVIGGAVTSIPVGGYGVWGRARYTINGYPYFISSKPGQFDLGKEFRAAFGYEVANGVPFVKIGDSIEWLSTASSRANHSLSMAVSFLNPGSPGDEAVLNAVADSLLASHGITKTGTSTNGTTGPLGESLIMNAGCVLTFTGAYDQVDVFYDQAVAAGSLEFRYNGTLYKTVSCAGAVELDKYSGPSPTGQTASGTYTITCTGANVTITGIDRLGVKTAGSLPRIRFFRDAHGSYTFANFTGAKITSIVKQASAFCAIKPVVVLALGINERNVVGPSGYATVITRIQATITDLVAAGVTQIFARMPLRPYGAGETFYASGLSFENLIGAMREVYKTNNVPVINTDAFDMGTAGQFVADGIHPGDDGHYELARKDLEGLVMCRSYK